MQSCKRLRQSLIISRQSAEPRRPGETALHYPTPRQQHKAFPGLRELYTFQLDDVRLGCLCGSFSRVARVNKGQLDILTRHCLHSFGQHRYLRPVLLRGRGEVQRQQLPQCVNGDMKLAALSPFGSIIASRAPLSGVDCSV
jgi:hypothetical protein